MLVRFTLENYLSFRERTELSMIASPKVRRNSGNVIRQLTRMASRFSNSRLSTARTHRVNRTF